MPVITPGSSSPGQRSFAPAGRADGEIERFIAIGTQRIERDVRADGNAGFELYAKITEDIDLGTDDVLFQPEGGDAET